MYSYNLLMPDFVLALQNPDIENSLVAVERHAARTRMPFVLFDQMVGRQFPYFIQKESLVKDSQTTNTK